MGDWDIPDVATGRVVEAGAVQTMEGEPLDGVILGCSVTSTRRIGAMLGKRVVVLELDEYERLTGRAVPAPVGRAARFAASQAKLLKLYGETFAKLADAERTEKEQSGPNDDLSIRAFVAMVRKDAIEECAKAVEALETDDHLATNISKSFAVETIRALASETGSTGT